MKLKAPLVRAIRIVTTCAIGQFIIIGLTTAGDRSHN